MKISDLFNIEYGQRELTSKGNLLEGNTIVISSQGVDNGCYGFCDFPAKYSPPIITVPRTGSIGEAFVQEFPCAITDDLMVLLPKKTIEIEKLYFIASIIRQEKWRYNYGREITPRRIGKLEIDFSKMNLRIINAHRTQLLEKIQKYEQTKRESFKGEIKSKKVNLGQIMDIAYGQREIHSKEHLTVGKTLVISSQGVDNGCYGFCNIEEKYIDPVISVPNTGSIGMAFVQEYRCCIDDNCLVLSQKEGVKLSIEELYFIAALIRIESWRYRYGRQITEKRLSQMEVDFSKMNYDKIHFIRKAIKNVID